MTDFSTLSDLDATVKARKGADPDSSYTAKLLALGVEKCAQKLGEEAVETIIAASAGKSDEVVSESADLLYHLLTLWAAVGVSGDDVMAELRRREGVSGLEEKASR